MSNPYLDNVMNKFTPPIPNCPVDFYYQQKSDGSTSFAVYDTASGLQLFGRDYPAPGQAAAASSAGNPYLELGNYLQTSQTAATAAGETPPPTDGMRVFHPFPFCPIAIGYWLPVDDAIGIAIIFAFTNTVLCYRKCEIDPTNHSVSMVQGLGPMGTCQIKFQLDYQGDTLVALEGNFTVTGSAVFPNIDVPVKIPV